MTEKMDIGKKKCITHRFRVSFPEVFEPKVFEGGPPMYSVTMLFDKRVDLSKAAAGSENSIRRAAFNAAVEKWGPKEKWPKKLRMPFRDGDEEKADTPGYENTIFVTAKSKTAPGLRFYPAKLPDGSPNEILNPEDFYAGCYARAELIAFAYDKGMNKGVSFSLQSIQKLGDGEPFSGRRDASDVYGETDEADEGDSDFEDDDLSGGDADDDDFQEEPAPRRQAASARPAPRRAAAPQPQQRRRAASDDMGF